MWSAWPERIELYLAPGLALVRAPGARQSRALAFVPGTPVTDMLAQVSVQALPWIGRRRWRAHVALGGAWCPAVGFELPEGVASRDEWLALGRSAVECDMQALAPDGLEVRLDGSHAGLASGCAPSILQALRDWCADRRARLASVAPAWAVATQCARVHRHAGGVLVHEPACVTALLPRPPRRAGGALDALSVPRGPGDGPSALPAAMQGYLDALHVDAGQLLALRLDSLAQQQQPAQGLPRLLAPHWAVEREALQP